MVPMAFQSTAPVWGPTLRAEKYPPRRHYFNPRPPCGGRPSLYGCTHPSELNFNPRPPCGGRPAGSRRGLLLCVHFNPRPPCGGRLKAYANSEPLGGISIHGPRVGADSGVSCSCVYHLFQSTAPVWGPTPQRFLRQRWIYYFNPRPPCGGRRQQVRPLDAAGYFNPRPPCGGRRTNRRAEARRGIISIHGPRVGADSLYAYVQCSRSYFNPRPPCGGRPS